MPDGYRLIRTHPHLVRTMVQNAINEEQPQRLEWMITEFDHPEKNLSSLLNWCCISEYEFLELVFDEDTNGQGENYPNNMIEWAMEQLSLEPEDIPKEILSIAEDNISGHVFGDKERWFCKTFHKNPSCFCGDPLH